MCNWPSSEALISIFKHYSFVCVSLFSKLDLAADRRLENTSSPPGPSWRTKLYQFACNRGECKKATHWFSFLHTLPRVRKRKSVKLLRTKITSHRFSHRSLCSNGIFDFFRELYMLFGMGHKMREIPEQARL